MNRQRTARRGSWLAALAILAAGAGCLSTPTGRAPHFHEGNALTTEARKVRDDFCPPPDAARELNKQPAGPHIVEPGDALLVQPASPGSPVRLPGDQVVLPDGTIDLGPLGRPCMAGKTVEQVESEANALVRERAPGAGPVIGRLVARGGDVYYVLGEVNAPGAFPLRGRETVLDAIVTAGGLTGRASRHGIIVSRPTGP